MEHPNIVSIHEVGVHEGRNYFSMDYVDGVNLAELLKNEPPSQRQAAEIGKTIAAAIEHAHRRGIVHRDLKPANILIDSAGTVRIVDFGLGKIQTADPGLTKSGQMIGTLRYMSPEQSTGTGNHDAAASDVYSLGTILYELLTGRPVFWSNSPLEVVRQVHEQDPVPPRRLDPRISRDLV